MLTLTTLLFACTAIATPHINKRGWNDWAVSGSSSKYTTTTRSVSSSTTTSYRSSSTTSSTNWSDWLWASSAKDSVTIIKSNGSAHNYAPATTNLADYPVPSGYVLGKDDGACDGASGSFSSSSSSSNYGTYNNGGSSGKGSGSGSGSGHGSGTLPGSFDSAPITNLLKPAVHWDMDMFSVDRVKPASSEEGSTLFFSEDKHPSQPSLSAFANYNFTGPSVAIDQSAYMSAAADGRGNMVVKFGNKASYNVAASTWSSESGMFLVGYIPNCGKYEGRELCYFKVSSLTFDSDALACHATGVDTKLHDAITHWEFRWDFYRPGKAPKPWDTPASGSGPGSRSGHGSNNTNSGSPTSSARPAFPTLNSTLPNPNTNRTNTTATCVAPVDTKYGLPTACLGYTFDQILDDNFGYEDWTENGWYEEMAGFGPQITMDDDIDVVPGSPAAIDKRGLGDLLNKAKDKIVMRKDEALKFVKDKVKQIPITGVTVPIDAHTKPYNINLKYPKPGQQYETHKTWKNAIKLFDKKPDSKTLLDLAKKDKETVYKGKKVKVERSLKGDMRVRGYCVDCSFTASIVTVGYAKGSLIDGFTAAALDVTADMTAVVQLGVEAEFELALAKLDMKLATIGVEGLLSIPGAISVGPFADVAVEVIPKLTLSGTLFAGAQMTWRQAKARLSWGTNVPSSASGWAPEIKPVFNATGEVGVALDVGLPIGVNFGISILNGKYKRSFAIEERPSIEAKASIGGSLTQEKQKDGSKKIEAKFGVEECKGIKASISFKNELGAIYTDPLKGDKKPLWKPKALDYEKELWDGCWKLADDDKEKKTATRRAVRPHSPMQVYRRQDQYDDVDDDADLAFIPIDDATNTTNLLPSNWTLTDANVINMLNDTSNTTRYAGDGQILAFPISPYNTSDGFQYTQLVSDDSSYMLASCSDGNIFSQAYASATTLAQVGCGALWTYEVNVTDAAIVADGSGRVMHYYPSTIDAVGVSRLRVSDMHSIPKDSAYISFVELENPNDGTYNYWPVDLENDITFGLAVCSYEDQPAKAFLLEDPSIGLDLLQSPDVKYSITGGDVTGCYSFFMKSGSEEPLDGWSGVAGDLDFADEWIEEYEYNEAWDGLDGPKNDPTVPGITGEIGETLDD